MSRYLVENPTVLSPLQEGDYPQTLDFIIPDVLDMSGKSALFELYNKAHTEILSKTTAPGIVVSGQQISVNFDMADTLNHVGLCHWILKVIDNDESITVAYGTVTIKALD